MPIAPKRIVTCVSELIAKLNKDKEVVAVGGRTKEMAAWDDSDDDAAAEDAGTSRVAEEADSDSS